MKKIFLLYFLIIIFNNSFGQQNNKIDASISATKVYNIATSFYYASAFDSALFYYKIAADVYSKYDKTYEFINCQLQIAQSFQVKGDFDSAFNYLHIAQREIVKRKIEDTNLMITYFYLIGSTFNKTGEFDSSLTNLTKAQSFVSGSSNDSLVVLVKRSLGNISLAKGYNNEALKYYLDALRTENAREGSSKIIIAALLQNIGIVYTNLREYDTAIVFLNNSINLKESVLNKNDPQLATGYLNYGRFLNLIGYPENAIRYLSKAEDIYISNFGTDYFGLAHIYFNKGSIFIVLRDFKKALTYHERAIDLYNKSISKNSPIIGDIIMNIGVIYEKLEDFEKAIFYYNESLRIGNSPESIIISYKSIARCYESLNDFQHAEENYKLAITKSEKAFGLNHQVVEGSYQAYGLFCITTKNYLLAEYYLTKAYSINLKIFGNKNKNSSLILLDLCDLYSELNKYDKALSYIQTAIINASINYISEDIYNNPLINEIDPEFNNFLLLYKKAYTMYDRFNEKSNSIIDLKGSFETSKLAISMMEIILASYKDEDTKISANEYVYDIYNLIVILAADLYSASGDIKYLYSAFEYSEKGKAAVLLSSIKDLENIEIDKIPQNIQKKEQELKRAIARLSTFLFDENQKRNLDTTKIEVLKKKLFDKNLSYDSLIVTIKEIYPEYYSLKYSVDVVRVEDIQSKLKSSEMFIEYKLIDSLLFIFTITDKGASIKKTILESDFKDKVLNFISSINQFPIESFDKEDYLEFIYLGNDLYRTLLDPAIQSNKFSKLFIIPDEIVGYLPFETLISEYFVPENIDFKNLKYVLKSFTISYSYSGTLIFKNDTHKKGNSNILAMAPVYNKNLNSKGENSNVEYKLLSQLSRLDYSLNEVNNIGSLFQGTILTGTEATETNFKKKSGQYGILHFAMHALIDDEFPMNSKLIFTLNNDTTDDGFLNTYEIYNLKLKAGLAVLSACKTGVGKLSKGEGVMSIARGFLFAGVPSIVMTLWEIEDISGSQIMYGFYDYLQKGSPTDEALRNAKLDYLNSSDPLQSHPYFWAAYVQIGKTDPLVTITERTMMQIIVFIIFLITFFVIIKQMVFNEKETVN